MKDNEIDQTIRLAVSLKHQGNLLKALALEEDCLKRCKIDKDTSPNGFGILYKALAKLYYINRDFSTAKQCYLEAIQNLIQCNPGDAQSCVFHLGCCSELFLRSNLASVYYQVLNQGGLPPGAPGSPITYEKVVELTNLGMDMFNNRHKNAEKVLGE